MAFSKQVAAVSFLIAALAAISPISAMPHPEVVRERHVIHAPIKFRFIHHYNIKKVPIFIKKHIHYYKSEEDEGHSEESHSNQIYDTDERYRKFEFRGPASYKSSHVPFRQSYHQAPEEEEEEAVEYDEPKQSQEEQEYYEYEYE